LARLHLVVLAFRNVGTWKQFCHREGHALKCEIDVCHAKVVWTCGPHPGSVHDKTICVEGGLCDEISAGNEVITNRVCGNMAALDDHITLALPNHLDHPELDNFKAGVKSRHDYLPP
jgi:hypothetical protein